jgi:hypothetical protein
MYNLEETEPIFVHGAQELMPPAYIAWQSGTTTLCQSRFYPLSQGLRIWLLLWYKNCAWKLPSAIKNLSLKIYCTVIHVYCTVTGYPTLLMRPMYSTNKIIKYPYFADQYVRYSTSAGTLHKFLLCCVKLHLPHRSQNNKNTVDQSETAVLGNSDYVLQRQAFLWNSDNVLRNSNFTRQSLNK